MATSINTPSSSLNLNHGLIQNEGVPMPGASLPSGAVKTAQATTTYVPEVDLLYEFKSLHNQTLEWGKPDIVKRELLEPAQFRDNLRELRENLKVIMAKASPEQQADLRRVQTLLNDHVSLVDLSQSYCLSLQQG